MITELVGAAGAGKTQFCLTLVVQCFLPETKGGFGANSGVVYIDTERKFSAQRLQQIAKARAPEFYDQRYCSEGIDNLRRLLDNTFVKDVDDSNKLLQFLNGIQPLLICGNKRLIILDSVAHLARKDFSAEMFREKQEALVDQAVLLKKIAETFKIVVVVTNQVTVRFGSDVYQVGIENSEYNENSFLAPALGNTWHHCVSNRLVLNNAVNSTSTSDSKLNTLTLSKSPIAPQIEGNYTICKEGIVMD
mmetsp:Transcript_18086/g.26781  ORF Transcript_18086/g.26781 Transcript_18086/m.26781 type:complete len:248 (+) Transcript_18086:44-787(+)